MMTSVEYTDVPENFQCTTDVDSDGSLDNTDCTAPSECPMRGTCTESGEEDEDWHTGPCPDGCFDELCGSTTRFKTTAGGASGTRFSTSDWSASGASNSVGVNMCGCTAGWDYSPPTASPGRRSSAGGPSISLGATGTAGTATVVATIAIAIVVVAGVIAKRRARFAKFTVTQEFDSPQMEWSDEDYKSAPAAPVASV
jgi:hypothetical protein